MRRRNWWLGFFLLPFLALSGGPARGDGGAKLGEGQGKDVWIGTAPHGSTDIKVTGSLGTTRSETEPNPPPTPKKWIGCWVEVAGTPLAPLLYCEGVTDTDDKQCTSKNASMIASLSAMNSDSFIEFHMPAPGSTGSATCNYLEITNTSQYMPKVYP
jgi:hypothetical protein